MANGREPKRKRVDRNVLVALAIVVVVVLGLFIFLDFGNRTATDSTAGGSDPEYSAPTTAEETAPESQQN